MRRMDPRFFDDCFVCLFVFFICMSNIWAYLIVMIMIMIALICLSVHLIGQQPAHLCGRNLSVGHCVQTLQLNLFISAVLLRTIDFSHFIPLSLILTLAGVMRSAESKSIWLYFLSYFSSDKDEI